MLELHGCQPEIVAHDILDDESGQKPKDVEREEEMSEPRIVAVYCV